MMEYHPAVVSMTMCFAVLPLVGCRHEAGESMSRIPPPLTVVSSVPARAVVTGPAAAIVEGAKLQVREAARYTTGYVSLAYPGGDLPRNQGVCTDVVVRALRHAGHDLQKSIHEDMQTSFAEYPRRWGLVRPDPNIDHRRVPNQMCFFTRQGCSLPLDADWRPGDLVYWDLGGGLDHCGVLSDRSTPDGRLLVIHNIGVCTEDDCLGSWTITGHFRFPSGT